ncbi:hypothetical protein OG948_16335 [Embleya sp. NBC_00888]|uniref:hypothetical protein n=1 Tax=Embleya sp. NBC_00888 TaxID=2975960 RepID=UPI00386C1F22|nr:hypothetical protein OG948_16335 [Embleya sp. NBC_00888]
MTGLLVIALLSAATACGGTAEDLASASSANKSSTTAPASSAPSSTSPKAPRAAAQLTTAELKRALLKKSDLPEGWESRVDTDRGGDDSPTESDSADCDRLMRAANPVSGVYPVLAAASIIAREPAPGGKAYALLGSGLTSLAPDDAERLISEARELIPRCADQRLTTAEFSGRFTAREIRWEGLGDETLATEFVTRVDSGQAWVHSVVLVRVGTTLIRVARVNLTGPAPQHPDEALVRKQVEQVASAMRGSGTG